jgi:hypothetical protein
LQTALATPLTTLSSTLSWCVPQYMPTPELLRCCCGAHSPRQPTSHRAALAYRHVLPRLIACPEQVRELLRFHNSAPHHYWGLFFFHTHQLREKCQVGHATVSNLDFTLGRFVKNVKPTSSVCRFQGWRPYWRPPSSHAIGSKTAGTCNASAIPGYLTMCPGTPSHALHRVCGDGPTAENSTKHWHKHRERSITSAGSVLVNGSFGMRSRDRRRGSRVDHPSGPSASNRTKTVRERLLELNSLKNDNLISATEYEALRARVLELLVPAPTGPSAERLGGT